METRVEKYREYRREIQAEAGKEVTAKSKTSEKIEAIRDKNSPDDTLSYDTVMRAHEIYSKEELVKIDPFKGKTRKNIPFVILASFTLVILAALTIFLGLLTFGGLTL